jgi:hypothetical protein
MLTGYRPILGAENHLRGGPFGPLTTKFTKRNSWLSRVLQTATVKEKIDYEWNKRLNLKESWTKKGKT